MYFDNLSDEEKVSKLIKPILRALQEAGGELERSDIKDRIAEMDDNIAEFEQTIYTSRKTGKPYRKFDFKFNFAVKELSYVGLVSYVKGNPLITLTTNGSKVNIDNFDVQKEVREKAKQYWEEKSVQNASNGVQVDNANPIDEEENDSEEVDPLDDFKTKLQKAIEDMSPAKFERFSRALLTKMGVKFTEDGVPISHDGGIDGFGYHLDENDFRTTKVVIQCKRYNSSPVGVQEINQFAGSMSIKQADYGVFITNSRYTKEAQKVAKQGKPITLIDGNDLIRLIIKYELYITPVTTYTLDDFYTEE